MPILTFGQHKNQTITDLKDILANQEKWIKVHAAEFLLWEGIETALVYDIFKKEEQQYASDSPYRIGVWRVLHQATKSEAEKEEIKLKLFQAYQNGPDSLHAVETLAKLRIPISTLDPSFTIKILEADEVNPYILYGFWNLYSDEKIDKTELFNRLLEIFKSTAIAPNLKMVISYVFRYVPLTDKEWSTLKQLNLADLAVDIRKNYLTTLLYRSEKNEPLYATWRSLLIKLKESNADIANTMLALSRQGGVKNSTILKQAYKKLQNKSLPDYNADLHATAAYSLLHFQQ